VFGRSKDSNQADDGAAATGGSGTPAGVTPVGTPAAGTTPPAAGGTTTGKGRPTPTRKEQEAANKRPLVPTDRKAASKTAKSAQREQREREYRAMQSGDERFMPAKDRGPVRRFARDWVDSRWNLGELFLPIALVALVLNFTLASGGQTVASFSVLLVLYVYVLAAILDGWLLWRGLKKRLRAKFTEAEVSQRGLLMYAVLRAFQIRPSRLPKPQVKHGQRPS